MTFEYSNWKNVYNVKLKSRLIHTYYKLKKKKKTKKTPTYIYGQKLKQGNKIIPLTNSILKQKRENKFG